MWDLLPRTCCLHCTHRLIGSRHPEGMALRLTAHASQVLTTHTAGGGLPVSGLLMEGVPLQPGLRHIRQFLEQQHLHWDEVQCSSGIKWVCTALSIGGRTVDSVAGSFHVGVGRCYTCLNLCRRLAAPMPRTLTPRRRLPLLRTPATTPPVMPQLPIALGTFRAAPRFYLGVGSTLPPLHQRNNV